MKLVTVIAVLLCLSSCRTAPCPQGRQPALSEARWEFREEHASAEWCVLHRTGPRFSAILTPSGVDQDQDTFDAMFEGPVRVAIQDNGAERYAWNGFDYSVWIVDQSLLVYPRFAGGIPGGSIVAVDLHTGTVVWETPLGHPPPQQGWSFWLNRKTIDVRGGRVFVWSMDGGRFLEQFDRSTGRSLGWREFTGSPAPNLEIASREDREEPTHDDVRIWLEQDAGGATVGRLLVLWESGQAFRSVRDAHAGTQWQWLGRWTRREEGGVHLLYDWLQVKRKGVVVGSSALDPPLAEALLQDRGGYYTRVPAEGGGHLKWSQRTKELPASALMDRAPEREFEDPRMRRSPLGEEDPR